MESLAPYILVIAFVLDLVFGDPRGLPHLIVLFGRLIARGEEKLNRGRYRIFKGGILAIGLVAGVFLASHYFLGYLYQWHRYAYASVAVILLFYCLANRTLMKEGLAVFEALEDGGLEAGRERLSWIVGRETGRLDEQQVKLATFETLSENLSDGVLAPLFYFALLGIPGAVAYKMVNTLDSMIGYKNERYLHFGRVAARLDDVANFLPARITALMMLAVTGRFSGIPFVWEEGKKHSSPNAGYPEAALAYILSCRFGGPNDYHGKRVEKPYIGSHVRRIEQKEIHRVVSINGAVSVLSVFLIIILVLYFGRS